MGYMGFGMQKWIYTMRPRRPFSKERKHGYDTITTGIDEHHFAIPPVKSRKRIPLWIFTIALVIILTVSFINLADFLSDQEKVRIKIDSANRTEMEEEFNSFYKSGIAYYDASQWTKAKTDLEFALRINPNHESALKYYLACFIKLSKNDPVMRNLTMRKLDSIGNYYPNNIEFNKLRIQFYLMTGDTTNAATELDQIMQ